MTTGDPDPPDHEHTGRLPDGPVTVDDKPHRTEVDVVDGRRRTIWVCEHVFTRHDPEPTGQTCEEQFDSKKSFSSHSNSHRRRPCWKCGRPIPVNGHTQHVATCTDTPDGVAWAVFEALLDDLLRHTKHLPTGSVCFISQHQGAAFMTQADSLTRAAQHIEAGRTFIVVPTDRLPTPTVAARWRREDGHDRRRPDPTPTPTSHTQPTRPAELRPGLGGFNLDTIT